MNLSINVAPMGDGSLGWRASDQNNYQSAMGYIDDLFKRLSRLLVIRVDFYVKASDPGHFDPEIMKDYLNRFLNNSRCNSLFNNQVGYMWGFEYGQLRGYHFHMLFFFDGAKSRQDITLGQAIGNYWVNNITQGAGEYHCSNFDKETLWDRGCSLGVGMISRHDVVAIQAVKDVAAYLIKDKPALEDYFSETGKRFRTFGRGC